MIPVRTLLSIFVIAAAARCMCLADAAPAEFDASTIPEEEWEEEFSVHAVQPSEPRSNEAPLPPSDQIAHRAVFFPEGTPARALATRPKARLQPVDPYPRALASRHVSGEAVVAVLVDPRGKVKRAKVISATHRLFGESAVNAIRKWEYSPGRDAHGRRQSAVLVVPVRFDTSEGLDRLRAEAAQCTINVADGISMPEAYLITEAYLRAAAPDTKWEVLVPVDTGIVWKVRFTIQGTEGALYLDADSGQVRELRIAGRRSATSAPAASVEGKTSPD